jgi:hypothetical protein
MQPQQNPDPIETAEFVALWKHGDTYKAIANKLNIKFTRAITLRKKLKLEPRMKSRYRTEGKIETPMSDADFRRGIETGHFAQKNHKAFCVLLFYSAIRKTEALNTVREDYAVNDKAIMVNVKRLKHSRQTPALTLPLSAPYMNLLKEAVEQTLPGEKVFPYSERTAYNIVRRVWKYPHLFRLSRITNFFLEGYTVIEVRSWTGLTLAALEYYAGIVSTIRMGESLAHHA